MPDQRGYPTEEELETIRNWDHNDLTGMMEYIRDIWWSSSWGFHEHQEGVYTLDTGGWSGNEEIIGAMRSNHVWWMMFWAEHRRGGHYTFYR